MAWSQPSGSTAEACSQELSEDGLWLPVNGELAERTASVGQGAGPQAQRSLFRFLQPLQGDDSEDQLTNT